MLLVFTDFHKFPYSAISLPLLLVQVAFSQVAFSYFRKSVILLQSEFPYFSIFMCNMNFRISVIQLFRNLT